MTVGTRRAVVLLAVLAVAHAALAVEERLDDGDWGLLWVASPFVLLTALTAVCVGFRRRTAATVLAVAALVLAVAAVPLYLIGLFHLPQAALALAVARRAPH